MTNKSTRHGFRVPSSGAREATLFGQPQGRCASPATRRWKALCVAAGLALLAGCGGAPRNFTNDNDKLRKENMELREQVQTLQQNIDLRVAEIKTLEQQGGAASKPAVEGASVPRAVAIRFARYSGAVDTNSDGVDDTVRIYVEPLDQTGRFLPVAGRAVLQVVAIQPDQPPTMLAEKTFDAKAVSDAYRTGLTGTHYSFEAPLKTPLPKGVDTVTVKLTFTDAATGATLVAESSVAVKR